MKVVITEQFSRTEYESIEELRFNHNEDGELVDMDVVRPDGTIDTFDNFKRDKTKVTIEF